MLTKNPMTALERRVVVALAMLYSFRMLGLFMVLPLLTLYAADFRDATPLLLGVALGAYGFTQALLQIPLGWLSDRVGRKPVIIGGLGLFIAGSVLAALADSVQVIAFGRALQGAGAISASVMALAADLTSTEQRTKAMAVIGISIGLSFAMALVFGPLLAAWGGLSAVFWCTAVLGGLGIGIVAWGVPTVPVQEHADIGARRGMFAPVLRDNVLQRLNGSVFLLHFTLTASFLVVPAVIESSLAVPREDHWKVYLPVLIISLLGMYPFLYVSERRGRPMMALRAAVLLLPASLAALFLLQAPLWLYVALCGFFAAVNYLEAVLPALVSKAVFSHGKGTALGVYATCQFLGAFAGGASGGMVYGAAGLPGLLWLCLGAIGLWLLLIWRVPAQRAEPVPA